jgi:hypothetical protein
MWHKLREKQRFWVYVTFVIHMYKTFLCSVLQHRSPRIYGSEWWMMVNNEFERKWSWCKQGIVLVFGWKDCGRQQKTKVRIAAVPAEI